MKSSYLNNYLKNFSVKDIFLILSIVKTVIFVKHIFLIFNLIWAAFLSISQSIVRLLACHVKFEEHKPLKKS